MTDTDETVDTEAEQCIVCLDVLRTSVNTDRSPGVAEAATTEAVRDLDGAKSSSKATNLENTQRYLTSNP